MVATTAGRYNVGVADGEWGFDIAVGRQVAEDFVRATGVGCALATADLRVICAFTPEGPGDPCSFCRTHRRLIGEPDLWARVHRDAVDNAERFGGSYIYFCPSSFTHFVSPVIVGAVVRAALIGGPVLSIDEAEFFRDEFLSKHRETPVETTDELHRRFGLVPYVEPRRVRSLAAMLSVAAGHVVRSGSDSNRPKEDALTLQSRISEYIHQLKSEGRMKRAYPVEKERALLRSIGIKDHQRAQQLLNEILGEVFFSAGGEFGVIRARVRELVVLLSRAAVEGGGDVEEVFGLNYIYLEQLESQNTIDQLAYWLSRIVRRFSDTIFVLSDAKHAGMLRKSCDYIRKHADQRISLDEVARCVSLSPSYFSRVFRSEMGEPFVAYLNRVRVSRAQELLKSGDLPLADIAGMVGFEDQSYFSKVFKRITGTSPGRYRDSIFD